MELKPDGKEVNTIWSREKLIPDATIKWSSVLCSGSFLQAIACEISERF